jgi:hypothetical protein
MDYYYDKFGWYTAIGVASRSTQIAPPTLSETTVQGQARANWDGTAWVAMPYVAHTAHDTWAAESATAIRKERARAECQTRIFAAVDSSAQINLASAAAAGQLDAGQMATYVSGLNWVAAMRAKWPVLGADAEADITSDASWPPLPAGVADLVALF